MGLLARAMGAEVVLATVAFRPDFARIPQAFLPEHNAVVAEIAHEQGFLFYDFAGEMKTDEAHMPDGRHVSQTGSDLKADLFFRFLVQNEVIENALGAAGP